MRTLALLILLAFACHANDARQKLMERLVDAGPGTAVGIQMADGRKINGRVLAVETEVVRLQTVVKNEIDVVELPFAEIRALNIKSAEVTFRNEMTKSTAGALGVITVFTVILAILGAIG